MVAGIVTSEVLERVKRQRVAAMVVYSLDHAASEETDPLSDTHAREFEREASAEGLKDEAFQGVVVEGAVGVGDVQTVVAGVKGRVEVVRGVHEAVEEVLPCIEDDNCEAELKGGDEVMEDDLGGEELPRSEGGYSGRGAGRRGDQGRKGWVLASDECACQSWVGEGKIVG